MARFNNRLNHVQVAAPCKVNWEDMLGDERVRFCGQCSLNVYNLSSMTRVDAEALIARTEGRLCVKFYSRFDGSIITKDCPIGLRAIKRRVSYAWQAIVSVTLTFLAGFGIHQAFSSIRPFVRGQTVGVIATDRIAEPPVHPVSPEVGQILCPMELKPNQSRVKSSRRPRDSSQ